MLSEIYDYEERLQRYKRIIKGLRNGGLALSVARAFTEARLEQYAGWIHGSKMASRYVHFLARDLEDADRREPLSVADYSNV